MSNIIGYIGVYLAQLTIETGFPDGTYMPETEFNGSFSSSGGLYPYIYSVTTGSLPDGIEMSDVGVLTGTFGLANTHEFTVQVIDFNGTTASIDVTVTVDDPG